jgi:hypothetical protein
MVRKIEPATARPARSNVGTGNRTTALVSHSKGHDINEESACGIRSLGIMYFPAARHTRASHDILTAMGGKSSLTLSEDIMFSET